MKPGMAPSRVSGRSSQAQAATWPIGCRGCLTLMMLCAGDRQSQEAWLQQQSAESSVAKQQCSQWRTLFRRLCWQQLKWGSCKALQVRTEWPSIRLPAW